jgi:hypothetical protein
MPCVLRNRSTLRACSSDTKLTRSGRPKAELVCLARQIGITDGRGPLTTLPKYDEMVNQQDKLSSNNT